MSLYLVQFERSQEYVEADSYAQAVDLWRAHDADYRDGDEPREPESVALLSDDPVIRAEVKP